jgi:hypothetical protein
MYAGQTVQSYLSKLIILPLSVSPDSVLCITAPSFDPTLFEMNGLRVILYKISEIDANSGDFL